MTKHGDNLRETLRRWRELGDNWNVYERMAKLLFADQPKQLIDYWQATYDLAKAHYEQCSSDDDSPADDDWMEALAKSINAQPSVTLWRVTVHLRECWQLEHEGPYGRMQIAPLSPDMTRGQVRRLLTAIGVEVRQ